MYDCKAPLSRFYYPETRRIINAFIIIIIIYISTFMQIAKRVPGVYVSRDMQHIASRQVTLHQCLMP